MKKKIFKLVLAIALATMTTLSACSSEGNNSLPADATQVSIADSSAPTKPESIADVTESSGADSSSLTEEDEDMENSKMVRINADGGLRMRGGPGTDYDIIKLIPQNAYAEVTAGDEENPDWLYVSYDGDFGWVSKEFVSYELDTLSTPKYSSTSWAKVYYDYLSEYEIMAYTYDNEEYTQWGHTVNGERRTSIWIQFMNYPEYDYPILVSTEGWPDTGVPDCFDIVLLIENGKVMEVMPDNPMWRAFFNFDGYPELNGERVAFFPFKDDLNNSKLVPENMQKALAWLKTQM